MDLTASKHIIRARNYFRLGLNTSPSMVGLYGPLSSALKTVYYDLVIGKSVWLRNFTYVYRLEAAYKAHYVKGISGQREYRPAYFFDNTVTSPSLTCLDPGYSVVSSLSWNRS